MSKRVRVSSTAKTPTSEKSEIRAAHGHSPRRVFTQSARFWYPPTAASFVLLGFAAKLPLEASQSRIRVLVAAALVVLLLWAMVISFRFVLLQRFGRWTSIALISTLTTMIGALAAKFQGGCSLPASSSCSVQDSFLAGATLGAAPVLVYALFIIGTASVSVATKLARYAAIKIRR